MTDETKMTKEFLYDFIHRHFTGIVSTISAENNPEAAYVLIAATPDLEIIFDTVKTSRKYANILQNPRVAAVIGWDDEITVQYEGSARVLGGDEDDMYREFYYSVSPDGRERARTWPDLVHIMVSPSWIRYSDFKPDGFIDEMRF